MQLTMPGDAALAAFASCIGTPTKDHHLDVHVDVMGLLRPHADSCEGKALKDAKGLTAEWTNTTLGYLSECRTEMGQKGFADEWVGPSRVLRAWLKDAAIKLKAAENGDSS